MQRLLKISIPFILLTLILSITACTTKTSSNSLVSATASTKDSVLVGAQAAKNDPNPTQEKMLIYAIQDEYIAHAEYDYILKTFSDQKPFSNIIKAEEKHIDMLTQLFKSYKFTLPKDEAATYVPHPKNIDEAFKAGVQAEIDNIAMYESFLKKQLSDDVKSVFTELRDGSKSHLEAFQKGSK